MPTRTPETITKPRVDTKTTVGTEFVVVSEEELEKPYRVIIVNDDVTPMEFVVLVLRVIFALTSQQSLSVMLEAHYNGRALVTTLPYEEATESVYRAQNLAREHGYPLSFYLEPDE
jgi:ATP-dependent Clp protease adaptor protein ClpS